MHQCEGGIITDVSQDGTPYPQTDLQKRSIFSNSTYTSVIFQKKIGSNCFGNRKGVICGECQDGYSEWNGSCIACPNPNVMILLHYILYQMV